MSSNEWSLPAVLDVVAGAAPERDMVVCESTHRTFGEVATRTRGLAAFLGAHGIGVRRPRNELARWESGQDSVALLLHNCPEYLEAMFGCYRARAVPFNVNQHYKPAEVRALLHMLGTEAVVYHRALGPLLAEALKDPAVVLVDVDDGSGVPPLVGSTNFEEAAVAAGGTPPRTLPRRSVRGVHRWHHRLAEGCAVAASGHLRRSHGRQRAGHRRLDRGDRICRSGYVVRSAAADARRRSMDGVQLPTGRGDDRAPRRLPSLRRTDHPGGGRKGTGQADVDRRRRVRPPADRRVAACGVRPEFAGGACHRRGRHQRAVQDRAVGAAPHVTIVNGYGASETGGMAFGARTRGVPAAGFAPAAGAAVLSADRTRFLAPGDNEIGWTARCGRVPLGYLGDRGRTEATFPVIDGQRVSVPGDRARLAADGSIVMLGRDSMVVNTGGEKVFVEEVEAVLRQDADIVDALVVGRPSERFGEEVVAIVQPRPGAALDAAGVREFATRSLARFKAPRAVALCARVMRHANGKADYGWARAMAADATDATRLATETAG